MRGSIDDLTYRIHLYEGVKDSDGNELHASDIIYAYDTLAAAGNRMSGDIAKYDHGEIVDDYTVDFIMKEPLTGLSDLSAILGQPYVYCEQAAKDHNLATDRSGGWDTAIRCFSGRCTIRRNQSGESRIT